MTLKHIRLELARDHDFPNGSRERGYELVAPLDERGHLLADEWRLFKERCRVRRFWPREKDEIGHLVRRGTGWAFDYDPDEADDDETGFKLDKHRFAPGEYVSFKDHGGKLRTFVVAAVSDLNG